MSVGGCSSYYSAYNTNHSSKLGTSYNRQQDIQEQNAKTGGNYDYNKEVSAANAQLVLNIVV